MFHEGMKEEVCSTVGIVFEIITSALVSSDLRTPGKKLLKTNAPQNPPIRIPLCDISEFR